MIFYCGINEKSWNGSPVTPGPHAVVSPVYGSKENSRRVNRVSVPPGTTVMQDSGAFCDGPGTRLSFEAAYDRQIKHAVQFDYADSITHRASYDLLIDEKWQDGKRSKKRWSVDEAEKAVKETVVAAKFMADQKDGTGKVLSAQGVETGQYLRCAQEITPLLRDGDIFGLGGWCIIGKMPKIMLPVFRQTITRVIPFLAKEGVKRVHIWGVIFPTAIGELQYLCDKYKIKCSTDSAGPSMNPAAFGRWGYGDWVDKSYVSNPNPKLRGPDRIRHVKLTHEWLDNIDQTQYYKPIEQENSNATDTHYPLPDFNRYSQLTYDSLWAGDSNPQRLSLYRT